MLYLHHATILTPHQTIDDGAVLIDGERIAALDPTDRLAAPDQAVVVDLHPGLGQDPQALFVDPLNLVSAKERHGCDSLVTRAAAL